MEDLSAQTIFYQFLCNVLQLQELLASYGLLLDIALHSQVINPFIGNLSNFMLAQVSIDSVSGSIPESLFAMFQMTFAIITPALIVGGYAERMKFSAVLLFSSIWLFVVYAPITHWVWGGGWLGDTLDYAGGTVVHITAGVAALVAAIVLGPRQEFLKRPIPPHNMTMTITGAAMLWVGWFGFNGGSALSAGGDAAMAILSYSYLCSSRCNDLDVL